MRNMAAYVAVEDGYFRNPATHACPSAARQGVERGCPPRGWLVLRNVLRYGASAMELGHTRREVVGMTHEGKISTWLPRPNKQFYVSSINSLAPLGEKFPVVDFVAPGCRNLVQVV